MSWRRCRPHLGALLPWKQPLLPWWHLVKEGRWLWLSGSQNQQQGLRWGAAGSEQQLGVVADLDERARKETKWDKKQEHYSEYDSVCGVCVVPDWLNTELSTSKCAVLHFWATHPTYKSSREREHHKIKIHVFQFIYSLFLKSDCVKSRWLSKQRFSQCIKYVFRRFGTLSSTNLYIFKLDVYFWFPSSLVLLLCCWPPLCSDFFC